MATIPPPNLGYAKPSEATIDQVNTWMRSTPWYQQQLRAWGQDPGHPTLTKAQSQQLLRQAQAQGVVVDEGNMEVDNHGNFNPKGHKLRNTLIVAGIAGATIATMGAAGAFSGAAAAGSAGAGAGAGAGAAGTAGGLGTAAGHGLLYSLAPTLVGTIGSVASNIYGTRANAGAQRDAANAQLDATRETLAFQRDQADRDFAMAETNRHANYDQWAARERRVGSLASYLGLSDREIPGYVPLEPKYAGSGQTPGAPGAGPLAGSSFAMPQGNWRDPTFQRDAIGRGIKAAYGRDPTDRDYAYWQKELPGLLARGQQLNDDQYAWKRLIGWQAGGSDIARFGPFANARKPPAGSLATYLS